MNPTAAEQISWMKTNHSGITHACWKAEGQQLWVAYGSGNVYRFVGVPKRWYDELMKATNPVQFMNKRIRTRFDMHRLQGFTPILEEE